MQAENGVVVHGRGRGETSGMRRFLVHPPPCSMFMPMLLLENVVVTVTEWTRHSGIFLSDHLTCN